MGRPSNRDLATRSPGIAGYPARIALVQRGELDSSRRRLELGPIALRRSDSYIGTALLYGHPV